MSEHLRDCPPEFYRNCRNAIVKCSYCGAGSGRESDVVLYTPVSTDAPVEHPYSKIATTLKQQERSQKRQQQRAGKKRLSPRHPSTPLTPTSTPLETNDDQSCSEYAVPPQRSSSSVQSRRVKAAFAHERKLAQRWAQRTIAKQTLRSGAVYGDGDLQLLGGLIQLDAKLRFTTKSFSLPWSVYEAGIRQGTNAWSITVNAAPETTSGQEHTLICLTESLFTSLLALASAPAVSTPSTESVVSSSDVTCDEATP